MNRLTDIKKAVPTPIEEHRIFYGRCVARLYAYEDTGLTPAEINQMKAEYSDTFQAHLNQLLDIKDKQIEQLEADNARLREIVEELRRR